MSLPLNIDEEIKRLTAEKRLIEEKIRSLKNESIYCRGSDGNNRDWMIPERSALSEFLMKDDQWIVRLHPANLDYVPGKDSIGHTVRIIKGKDRKRVIRALIGLIDNLQTLKEMIDEHDKTREETA